MRLYRGLSTGLISGIGALMIANTAQAQDATIGVEADAEADTAAGADAEADTAAGADAEAQAADAAAEEPAPEASPEPAAGPAETTEPAARPAPATDVGAAEEDTAAVAPSGELDAAGTEEAAGAEAAEDEEAVEEPDGLSWMLFADAYATVQTSATNLASPGHRAYASNSPVATTENGFSLSFVGLDATYEGDGWGVTSSLRFGPSVPIFYGGDTGPLGIDAILQGYVTWAPTDSISVDVGQFGTIFGAEVAESWQNLNYTRGGLYYLMQPFWHTGARASFDLMEGLSLNAMLVDDANQITLGNNYLQGAVQVAYSTGDFSAALGTLQTLGDGSDTPASSGFDRFVDLVISYTPGDFSLLFNGDFNASDGGGPGDKFYGLSLAAGYQIVDPFGVALRGEYLDQNTDLSNDEIITGTLTLDAKPVPGSDNLVVRWDNRIEADTGANIFFDDAGAATDVWYSSTIGVVAHTDGLF